MKGRYLPLSPEKSLHQWKVDEEETLQRLNSCLVPSSSSTSQQRWFRFYCVLDTMALLFSVHKLCPDDSRWSRQWGQCQKCLSVQRSSWWDDALFIPTCSCKLNQVSCPRHSYRLHPFKFLWFILYTNQLLTHVSRSPNVFSLTLVQCPLLWRKLEQQVSNKVKIWWQ